MNDFTFNPYTSELPIVSVISDLLHLAKSHHRIILKAAPGAGKSTLVPLCLLNEAWLENKKIILLEPRRLAARNVAYRMAELLNEQIGETVGYRIRFESKISSKTRIEVVTEGILTRMLQSDNAIEQVGLVIFDEFHERNLHADLALALCSAAQEILRPDLKILLMSATMETSHLSALLNAPVIESEGRQFPVDVHYVSGQDAFMIAETAAKVTQQAVKAHDGDALVFLPGESDIKKAEILLKQALPDFSIHPLFGKLSQHLQQAAIIPNKFGKRKIVLATNIAETSLTIEGIKIVVDSGLEKTNQFDPKSGLSKLETVQISKDAAEQRTGRAGRLSPGVCIRMWSKIDHERLALQRTPEILEADLASLVLELANWSIENPAELLWVTAPPDAHVSQAIELLELLEAIEKGKITAHGKQLHRLACHPRIAHLLLSAKNSSQIALACDIAAVLEEKDPLPKEAGIAICLRIELLRRARQHKQMGNKLNRINMLSEFYCSLMQVEQENEAFDPYDVGLLISYAYPERIASARPGNNAQFLLSNGKIAAAGHRDDLANEPWLAIAHLDARNGLGKIYLAAPIQPKDLISRVKEVETVKWDSRNEELIAVKELKIGNIILQSKPLTQPSQEAITQALLDAIKKEGNQLLDLSENLFQLMARYNSLSSWEPSLNLQRITMESLLNTPEKWLSQYLTNIKQAEDFKKINTLDALKNYLGYETVEVIQKLCPSQLKVPSGSEIKITYTQTGDAPKIEVRIQEVFGLKESPKICHGKIEVLFSLLSPGFKPVQMTKDLKSFWNNTYPTIKNELKRRYPKHSWPESPWEASPTKKTISRPKN